MSVAARLAFVTLLAPAALAACAGAEAGESRPATETPAPKAAAAEPSLAPACEAFFARAHTCTDPYIAGLVDLRVELDKPAGIAAEAQAGGKGPLVAQALTEWEADSQPERVVELCAHLASSLAPADAEQMRGLAEQCVTAADCDGFVACAMPLQREHLARQ